MVEWLSLVAIAAMLGCLAYPFFRKALTSLTIAIGLFVVFAIQLADQPYVLHDLAFSPAYLRSGDGLYTTFTATFLHANFFHIFSNVFMLIVMGMVFEEKMGSSRFLAIFLTAGVVGNLAYGIANLGDAGYVVGASGAISGILGAVLMLYPRQRTGMMIFPIPVQNLPVWALVALMMAWQIVFILDPNSNVAWEGHVGGFVAGAILAPLLMRMHKEEGLGRSEAIDIMLFATTTREREIAERIRAENVPDVRDAWLEELAKTARCPRCNAKVAAFRGGLRCGSGHRFRIRR